MQDFTRKGVLFLETPPVDTPTLPPLLRRGTLQSSTKVTSHLNTWRFWDTPTLRVGPTHGYRWCLHVCDPNWGLCWWEGWRLHEQNMHRRCGKWREKSDFVIRWVTNSFPHLLIWIQKLILEKNSELAMTVRNINIFSLWNIRRTDEGSLPPATKRPHLWRGPRPLSWCHMPFVSGLNEPLSAKCVKNLKIGRSLTWVWSLLYTCAVIMITGGWTLIYIQTPITSTSVTVARPLDVWAFRRSENLKLPQPQWFSLCWYQKLIKTCVCWTSNKHKEEFD